MSRVSSCEEPLADGVGGARGEALGGGVLAADALAGDEGDALGEAPAVEAGGELRDLGGRVLAVAVEGADGGAAGEGDAAVDGGRLAGAGGVPDEADLGEALGEGEDAGGGVVVGAVVDVDDLVGGEGRAGGDDRLGDEVDVLGLVLQRHDDGEPGQVGLPRSLRHQGWASPATAALPMPRAARSGHGRDIGRSERIRTSGPLLPKQVRYQAALHSDTGRVVTTEDARSSRGKTCGAGMARPPSGAARHRDRARIDARRVAERPRWPAGRSAGWNQTGTGTFEGEHAERDSPEPAGWRPRHGRRGADRVLQRGAGGAAGTAARDRGRPVGGAAPQPPGRAADAAGGERAGAGRPPTRRPRAG